MVELPQELIEAIVDYVGQMNELYQSKDRETLQQCSLAARVFLAPSQRHLFQSFSLGSRNIETICAGIISNPTLASYVRCLQIHIFWFEHLHSDSSSQLLASFLPLLHKLDHLVLNWFNESPDWNSFPAALRVAFNKLISLPTLRCFGISDCYSVPASVVIHAMASFEQVTFTNVCVSEDEHPPFMTDHRHPDAPVLRRLLLLPPIGGEDPTLKTVMLSQKNTRFLTNLQHLELRLSDRGTLKGYQEIALSCSGSLEHLAIDFNDFIYDAIEPFPKMPATRVLTLMCSMWGLQMSEALQTFSISLPASMPGLEILNLVLDSEHLVGTVRWHPRSGDMDVALSNLRHLREVHFTISCSFDEAGVEDVFRKAFPVANGEGLLTFTIYPRYGMARRAHKMQCMDL